MGHLLAKDTQKKVANHLPDEPLSVRFCPFRGVTPIRSVEVASDPDPQCTVKPGPSVDRIPPALPLDPRPGRGGLLVGSPA